MKKIKKNKNLSFFLIVILVVIYSAVIYQISMVSAQSSESDYSSLGRDLRILGRTRLGDVSQTPVHALEVTGSSYFEESIGIKVAPDDNNALKVSGTSHLGGRVGINTLPDSTNSLNVLGTSKFASDVSIEGREIKLTVDGLGYANPGEVYVSNANIKVNNGSIEVIGANKQVKAPFICVGSDCRSAWPEGGSTGGIGGGGTSGYVPRWTAAATLASGTIRDNGARIGVGTGVNSSYMMVVNGAIGASEYVYYSDLRLKNNVKTLNNSLNKITSLRGVSFNWKEDGQANLGLIAQEVERVYPELVVEGDDGIKSVKYGNLVAPLIEAVKEQQKQIESLELRIKQLEARK